MTALGFHASHEQLSPRDLLDAVCLAEAAGFDAAMCSDHFAPWGERQGHSGHAWTWLGAALQATSLTFGVVTAPGQRYHPAVAAQAMATLAGLFPGRFWAALGSGEALNEHVTGDPWPDKETRDARLLECVDVIRSLLAGEEVTHDGLVRVDHARLWDVPADPPRLLGAAVSASTAGTVGGWADGLITIAQERAALDDVLDAFRQGGGAGKPVFVQAHLSWAPDEADAERVAHEQWRTNVFGSALAWELAMPAQFDDAARFVSPADVREAVKVSSDLGWHREWIAELLSLDVDGVYLHHVGQEQRPFIETFGAEVLPAVRSAA